MELEKITEEFGLDPIAKPQVIGSGHINETYLVQKDDGQKAILQKINIKVFKNPGFVMSNLAIILDHLRSSGYPYQVMEIIPARSGQEYILESEGCWRLLSFLNGKEARIDSQNPGLSGTIAEGYGNFLKFLFNLDPLKLKEVIPNFHNPDQRFNQMLIAIESAEKKRIDKSKSLIDHALALSGITSTYTKCITSLPVRITHGDAKASNILLNQSGNQILGIIDLDTVMPGYLMNDLGDMVRSMCNSGQEDEEQLSNVNLDPEIFYQLVYGFLETTHEFLSQEELDSFLIGISSILYEQFIRFLSDYLNGDIYYSTQYENQNLNRARVHLKLLMDFQAREEFFIRIINQCLAQLDTASH